MSDAGLSLPLLVNATPASDAGDPAKPPRSVTVAVKRTRAFWHMRALVNAFGPALAKDVATGKAWNVGATASFDANHDLIHSVYDYYGVLYQRMPSKLIWAGLARVGGGAFFKGFNIINDIQNGAGAATVIGLVPAELGAIECQSALRELMTMGKNIFTDVAWQHEAYTTLGIAEIRRLNVEGEFERKLEDRPVSTECAQFWEDIDRDDAGVSAGNLAMFRREQMETLPPGYANLHNLPQLDAIMTAFADSPHPWGHSFNEFFNQSLSKGTRVVTTNDDRWNWMSNDILPAWSKPPESERTRLVTKSLEDLMNKKF